jgi:hypothetical protein
VKAAAPLEITDEGVAFNWQDPRVYEVVADVVLNHPDSGKVKVDDGDTADFLENQLVDYAGATGDWIAVHVVKPAPHAALQARVAKADVQAAANPPGNAAGTANSFAVHWQPTDSGQHRIVVIDGDAHGRMIRYWLSGGTTIAGCVGDTQNKIVGTTIAESGFLVHIGASSSDCALCIDPANGNLLVILNNYGAGADDAYFYVRVDDFGPIPSDGYQSYAQQ